MSVVKMAAAIAIFSAGTASTAAASLMGSPSLSTIAFASNLTRRKNRTSTQIYSYRKFHEYGWRKLMPDNSDLDTVPEDFRFKSSPVKGAPPGTNVVANIRSISQFPFLGTTSEETNDSSNVLRLARSAFLETQSPKNEALVTPMTIHVLNFVLFPNPHVRERNDENGGAGDYLGLPILGADIVSLPGNKHLVALDFQPVLPLEGDDAKLFPHQYSHLEEKLLSIHAKYQKGDDDSTPLLPWGGDIPPQAERFFSPYALWTRVSDENALETVSTVVWDAFQEYVDLYFELMSAVQSDVDSGTLYVTTASEDMDDSIGNPASKGQMEYLEYRRANDPARPMLQRLYGNEWAESVIGEVLFPDL